jgi:surface protein
MIKGRDIQINLKIKNNTSLTQQVNILGILTPNKFANVSDALYSFDLSTEVFTATTTVSIVISNTSNPTPITYTVTPTTTNIQGVVDALNTLNQGIFQYSGTTIYVSSSYYIYGSISVNSNAFISLWNTNNTSGGSSANNQVQLPLDILGVYNFVVNWGDGTSDVITTWNQPETLHTYSSIGTYTIIITGQIDDWSFGNALVNDCEKILNITSWGNLRFGINTSLCFYQCVNLDLSSVSDVPDLSLTTSLGNTFDGCTTLTTINRSNEWVTTNITSMIATFANATNFNSDISNWDVSNVTDANTMFESAFAFNQNIGAWDVSIMTNMTNFMRFKTNLDYSSANLNAIYNGWSTLLVQPNIVINFGTIKYTIAGAGGKAILQGVPNNWIITDGGI